MAMPNIVYLPGVFGTDIGYYPIAPIGPIPIWAGVLPILTGGLINLQLAPDGVSPGPLTNGIALQPLNVWDVQYYDLAVIMQNRGWNVLYQGYDWRLSVLNSAQAVLASIANRFGQQPVIFVAHSMGGLVARACYGLLLQQGLGQQVLGIVSMGSPYFGSWEPVRGFFGLPTLYNVLQKGASIIGPWTPGFRQDFLDVMLASWPGWYELLPWRDAGPLASTFPAVAQALYTTAFYAGGNPYVSAARLASAVVTQHFLANAFVPNGMRCIRGVGLKTAFMTNAPNPLSSDAGYQFTDAGDQIVPRDNATAPTAVNIDLVGKIHGLMPLDAKVQAAVVYAVQTIAGPGA